jgi:copper resistance protein C
MHRRGTLLTALATTSALLLVLSVPSAFAHVTLVSTSPREKSVRTHAPASVSMLFSGPLRSGALKVVGSRGRTASKGRGGRDPRNINRLLVALKSGLKTGRYTAHGSTVSADGHKQTWTFSFTIRN